MVVFVVCCSLVIADVFAVVVLSLWLFLLFVAVRSLWLFLLFVVVRPLWLLLFCTYIHMSVRPLRVFSQHWLMSLIFWIKLMVQNTRKVTEPDLSVKVPLSQIWPKRARNGPEMAQKLTFSTFSLN